MVGFLPFTPGHVGGVFVTVTTGTVVGAFAVVGGCAVVNPVLRVVNRVCGFLDGSKIRKVVVWTGGLAVVVVGNAVGSKRHRRSPSHSPVTGSFSSYFGKYSRAKLEQSKPRNDSLSGPFGQ